MKNVFVFLVLFLSLSAGAGQLPNKLPSEIKAYGSVVLNKKTYKLLAETVFDKITNKKMKLHKDVFVDYVGRATLKEEGGIGENLFQEIHIRFYLEQNQHQQPWSVLLVLNDPGNWETLNTHFKYFLESQRTINDLTSLPPSFTQVKATKELARCISTSHGGLYCYDYTVLEKGTADLILEAK